MNKLLPKIPVPKIVAIVTKSEKERKKYLKLNYNCILLKQFTWTVLEFTNMKKYTAFGRYEICNFVKENNYSKTSHVYMKT